MNISELENFGLPKEILKVLKESGVETLFEPQEVAVNQGILNLKDSYLLSVPTASGKTLIAELLMIKSILEGRKKKSLSTKCLYIVPLRALATEKYEEFKKWEKLGIRVGMSTGDLDSSNPWLAKKDIIVATSEKVDSLTRHNTEWLRDISVLVVDEVHLVHDSRRGPTLEVVIARMRHIVKKLLILALSATVQNPGEISGWLDAKLIESDWRPVELREGVYYNHSVLFNDSHLMDTEAKGHSLKDIASSLAMESLKDGGQSLVFLNTRRSVESFADGLDLSSDLSSDEKMVIENLSNKALNVLREPTKTCIRLSNAIKKGVAFHHAGLLARQRKIVEDGFRQNLLKIISATPTLAAGVNLPARRVIIKDYHRYDVNLGRREIPVLEYKQMAGRAGRPGYDDYGEALLIARSDNEKDFLLDNYILAEPEEIFSKLSIEAAIRAHVLSTISSNFANTGYALLEFFSKTLFAYQRDVKELEEVLEKVVEFLKNEDMIKEAGKSGEFMVATPFGRRVTQLYLDPLSAVVIRNSLEEAAKKKTRPISYLHSIARAGELGGLYLRKGDFENYQIMMFDTLPCLLTSISETMNPWDQESVFAEVKMASFLVDWIHEFSEEEIWEKYNIAAGDVRNKVEIAVWMLYSMHELGRLFQSSKLREIKELERRVKYGIRRELLSLVSLKGVGRVRARFLYRQGFKNLSDIKKADVEKLSSVESIGEKLAKSILDQLAKA
jgi:helicase